MDCCVIDKSSTGLPGLVRDMRERILELEKVVFANRDDDISLPDCHIPDDLPEYIVTKQRDEKSEDLQFLDQLLDKLTDIKDQSSLLHLELQSIEQMDRIEDPISDDVSICTENTDAAQELIDKNPDVVTMPDCSNCKACLKSKAKEIKKEKKAKEKERRAHLKQLKINEREVLLIEQKELQHKLSEFRSQIDKMSELSEKQKIELVKKI